MIQCDAIRWEEFWNSVDMAYRDEDRILDSIHRKQNCLDFYYDKEVKKKKVLVLL